MDLIDPDHLGDERTLLTQFLDYQRAVLVRKVEGLTAEQLTSRAGASDLTLAGLVKHMAYVEDRWFTDVLLARPLPEPWASAPFDQDEDWEFHSAGDNSPDELLALYAAACERGRAAVAGVPDLDTLAAKLTRRGNQFNLRWIMLHMVEETARHLGHADFLREAADGATGD